MIRTKNEKALTAHSVILGARTRLKIVDGKVDLEEFSFESVEYYLSYIYTTSMDWTLVEHSEIRKLAELYGPTDLAFYFSNPDDDLELRQVKSQSVDLNAAILNPEASTQGEEEEKDLVLANVLASQKFILPEEPVEEKDISINHNDNTDANCIIIEDSPVAQRKQFDNSSLKEKEGTSSRTNSPSPVKDTGMNVFTRSPSIEIISCNLKQVEKNQPDEIKPWLDTSVDLFEVWFGIIYLSSRSIFRLQHQ